jgi:16S rRNA C1402 (ribose-2'-O) methylase RsmI
MPTNTKSRSSTKKALTDYYVHAPLGAGEVLVEKSRELSKKAWTEARKQRKQLMKTYRELAKRGERMVISVRNSAHTRRAVDQAKTARTQVKSAVTSIRKTADATTTATKAAAKKVG